MALSPRVARDDNALLRLQRLKRQLGVSKAGAAKPRAPKLAELKKAVESRMRADPESGIKRFRFAKADRVTSAAKLPTENLKSALAKGDAIYLLHLKTGDAFARLPRLALMPAAWFYSPAGKLIANAGVDEMSNQVLWL